MANSLWRADPEGHPLVDKTVGQILFEAAARNPTQEAIVYPGVVRLTWAQMQERAVRLAHGLRTLSLVPGQHVAVWAPNVLDWTTLQWAAGLAGLVLVTVNPAYRAAELAYVLGQSETAVVFYEPEYRGQSQTPIIEAARQHGLPKLRQIIRMDQIPSLLGDSSEPLPQVTPLDLCMLQYTSGTTGFPKGAMLTHRGLVNNALAISRRRGDHEAERIVHGMPFFHVGGCILHTLLSAATGTTQIPLVTFDAGAALAAITAERATQFCGVPTMVQLLLNHPERPRYDLSTLRIVTTGGAPVPIDLAQRVQRELACKVIIIFGQTEASPVITQTAATDTPERAATTVGYPMPHLDIRISDASGAVLPIDTAGEICLRGYSLMKGYYRRPADSPIDSEGWLHTGDLARMDAHGYVSIVGRSKDLVIRGGENIYPVEIENMLRTHPAVLDAQVVGVPDERYGEELCAVVRVRPGMSLTAQELRDAATAQLARYKSPRYVCFVTDYPLTDSGKVQKYKLREQVLRELGLPGIPP